MDSVHLPKHAMTSPSTYPPPTVELESYINTWSINGDEAD